MLAVCAAIAVAQTNLTWPAEPITSAWKEGTRLATRKPRIGTATAFSSPAPRMDLTVVYGDAKRTLGTWSNGNWKREVEWSLWLSPALMSRWHGLLSRRELWSDQESERRWAAIREELEGSVTFVVQLSAFPKLPTFGVGDYEPPQLDEIRDVRFVVQFDGGQAACEVVKLAEWRAREKPILDDFRWWLETPLSSLLTPEFEREQARRPIGLGDYARAWYVVRASIPEASVQKITLRVLSARKERKAEYRLPAEKP